MHVWITCFHIVTLHHAVQLYPEFSDLHHHLLSHSSKVVVTLAIEKGSHATEKRRCPRRELRVMRENWQRMCVLCVLDILSSSPECSLWSRIMKRRVTKQAPICFYLLIIARCFPLCLSGSSTLLRWENWWPCILFCCQCFCHSVTNF